MPKLRSVLRGALASPFLAATLFSQSAFALSCAQTDLGQAMEGAKASEKLYYVLVGRFYHNAPKQAPIDYENQFRSRPPTVTPSYFEGYALTPNPRTDTPLRRYPVDIETSCAGPWCGSPPAPGMEQIAFVEDRPGQSPVLRIGPCPGLMFSVKPQERQVDKLRTCFDKSCGPTPDRPYLR